MHLPFTGRITDACAELAVIILTTGGSRAQYRMYIWWAGVKDERWKILLWSSRGHKATGLNSSWAMRRCIQAPGGAVATTITNGHAVDGVTRTAGADLRPTRAPQTAGHWLLGLPATGKAALQMRNANVWKCEAVACFQKFLLKWILRDGEGEQSQDLKNLKKHSHGSLNNTWTAQIRLSFCYSSFFSPLLLCKMWNIKAEEKLKPAKKRKMEALCRSCPWWSYCMDHSQKRRDLVNDSIRSYDCIFKYSNVPRV